MTHYVVEDRKARTEHRCSDCGRIIEPGETYRRGVGFDGTAWTWKDCAHCEAVLHMYDLAWDGEYNADHFHEWTRETGTIAELRHAAGYRMKWRTRLGTLLPVPGSESHDRGSADG